MSCCILVTGCASVPRTPIPMGYQRAAAPTTSLLVQHINCEIFKAMARNESVDAWKHLATNNFIAAVQLKLDVTDTGSIAPNLSFIHPSPVGTQLGRTLAIVGQYNSTRDSTFVLSYFVDLAELWAKYNTGHAFCDAKDAPYTGEYLGGDLRLGEAIGDGLTSLDATSDVSIYGYSGPTKEIPEGVQNLDMIIASHPTDAKALATQVSGLIKPGSPLFAAIQRINAQSDVSMADDRAIGQLKARLDSLSDTLKEKSATPEVKTALTQISSLSAFADKPKLAGKPAAAAAGAQGAVGSTSFQTILNFAVTFGASGGPNWTLVHFKGPGGGAGGGGGGASGSNLLGYSRGHTDTLTITFQATCRDKEADGKPATYWDSVPTCTSADEKGKQTQAAAAGAQYNNVLSTLSSLQLRR